MKTLEQLAQAVVDLFPVQTSTSGLEATTHRVEIKPVEGQPKAVDFVIVQMFPTPARRYELRIEQTSDGWLSHPRTGPDTYIAQTVALRLQRNALGHSGPTVKSVRNAEGLFACSFHTELLVETAPEEEERPTAVELPTSPAPEPKPEPARARRVKDVPSES